MVFFQSNLTWSESLTPCTWLSSVNRTLSSFIQTTFVVVFIFFLSCALLLWNAHRPSLAFKNISLIIIVIVVYIESNYVFYLLLRKCCKPTQRHNAATNTAVHVRSLSFSLSLVCYIRSRMSARRVALMLYCMFIHSIVYSPEYMSKCRHGVYGCIGSSELFVRLPDGFERAVRLFGASANFFVAYKILFILKCSLLIGWCSR